LTRLRPCGAERIPRRSLRGTMPLSQEDLAEQARRWIALATRYLGTGDFEDDTRQALQRLTEDNEVAARHPRAVQMIKRALAVNMDTSANRKGDLPRALGFVTRQSKPTKLKHLAIIFMIDHLQDYADADARDFALARPYWPVSRAAQAVA